MKYKLSENAVLNKTNNDYFLSDISMPIGRYLLNFPLFSVLKEIETEALNMDEIFARLETKFTNLLKDSFIEETEPILKELVARKLINTEK